VNPPALWLQRDVPGLTRAAVPVLVHPGWQIGLKVRHGNLSINHRLYCGLLMFSAVCGQMFRFHVKAHRGAFPAAHNDN